MKTKIVIFFIIVVLLVLSFFVLKSFIDNSVSDKTGMVRTPEDDIILCRYSNGGGMDGVYESIEIRESENGGAVITYEYMCHTADKDYTESAVVSYEALSKIRAICKKYSIFSWGKLKDSETILLDGPVTSVTVSTGDLSYTYNSNQEIPEYAYGITTELYNVMMNYLKGVD